MVRHMRQVFWVDRGQSVSFEKPPEDGLRPNCVGVARLGSLQTSGTVFTVWMQLRGSAWVESKEGRFRLRQREWIAFEKVKEDGRFVWYRFTVVKVATVDSFSERRLELPTSPSR